MVLNNIATTSEFIVINALNSSFDDFTYQRGFNADKFLNLGVTERISLPVEFKRSTDAVGTIDANSFAEVFFEDFAYTAVRQHGLLNAMDTNTLTLNGARFDATDVPAKSKAIFPYYAETDLDEYFEASTPDRFAKCASYNPNITKRITSYRADGKTGKGTIPVKPDNDENIFTGGFKHDCNTRRPMLVFDKYDATTKYLHCVITFGTFLPFSLFGLPTESNGLYGVTDFSLSSSLARIQTAAQLLSNGSKTIAGGPPMITEDILSDIQIDTSSQVTANDFCTIK